MVRSYILAAFFLLFASLSHGREVREVYYSAKDTLPCLLDTGWVWSEKDDPAHALIGFNDSAWQPVDPAIGDSASCNAFQGFAWFRLHFNVDSSWCRFPLALKIEHPGASRVYLDGRLMPRPEGLFDSAMLYDRYNPKLQPYIFNLSPGPHILAVRYSYPEFKSESKKYGVDEAGFKITVANAAEYCSQQQLLNLVLTSLCMFLVSLFLTLAVTHFFHFAYDRSSRSNLMFSFFSLSIAYCVFTPLYGMVGFDPLSGFQLFFWLAPVCALAAVSFSGFINELFGNRRRFYFIVALGFVAVLIYLFSREIGWYSIGTVAAIVSLEGVVLIIRALWRRVKGARIIGVGMLLMALMAFGSISTALIADAFGLGGTYNGGAWAVLLLLVALLGFITMPLSLSAFLAWNFARVNKDLKLQLHQVNLLSEKNLAQEQEKQRILASRGEELEQEVAVRTEELRKQKQKSDDLLHNILPEQVADELKDGGRYEARMFDQVSVLFTDFVDFTQIAETLSPAVLVQEIDQCFQAFDRIIEQYGLEKIKTVGDAYIAVAGLPAANADHARIVVKAALDIRSFIEKRLESREGQFSIRLGVHSGPVVAGIVGLKKYAYDIWGDTVNTAARMEQHSEAGKINISSTTFVLLNDEFTCKHRGMLEVKHKGRLDMYFVEGLKESEASGDS